MRRHSLFGGLLAVSLAVLTVAGPSFAQSPEPSGTPAPSGCVWDPDCGSILPPEPTPSPTATPDPNATPTPTPEETEQPEETDPPPDETDTPKETRSPKPTDEAVDDPVASDEAPSPPPDGFVAGSDGDMPSGFSTGDPPFKALPGPRSTTEILKLLEKKGIVAEKAARTLAPFPVFGAAVYSNDWHYPRYTPSFHLHEGTDIFAARGTPVVSSADGEIWRVTLESSVGGRSVWVKDGDGTGYYYAHLNAIAVGISVGTKVRTGDLIGYVGSTGNAAGGQPHLHFEIHPQMGEAVSPVPYLDTWLYNALQKAKGLPGGRSPTRLGQPELVAGWVPASAITDPRSMEGALSVIPVAARPAESSAGTWPTILTLLAGPVVFLLSRRRSGLFRVRRES
jgi:murein DD-endopeptidase MepM/ murein hydrolase activator NlpD